MANGKPHTHEIQMSRKYGFIGGPYVVQYGDQQACVKPWWCVISPCMSDHKPTERRVNAAVRRAIRKHDKGSRRYETMASMEKNAYRTIADLNASLRTDEWASERVS